MAAYCSAPNIYIRASPHVSLFSILTLIRYDHSVISPPADNSFVLQIVNSILKSNNIIITGGPFSLQIHFRIIEPTSMDTRAAVAPGEAYVIRAGFPIGGLKLLKVCNRLGESDKQR